MRKAARAIIVHDDKLIIVHRNKFGTEYDTLPGGRVEIHESVEDALRRELREETCLEVGKIELVFVEQAGDLYGSQYIYKCEYVGGQPNLSPTSEEAAINKLGQNTYEPMWLSINKLKERPFVSEELKRRILSALQNGFPEKPEHFSTA